MQQQQQFQPRLISGGYGQHQTMPRSMGGMSMQPAAQAGVMPRSMGGLPLQAPYGAQPVPTQAAFQTGSSLPPPWEECRDATGRIYYKNHVTKTTQWVNPILQQGGHAMQQPGAGTYGATVGGFPRY